MAGGLAAAHRSGAIGSRASRLFPRSGTRLALRNPAVPGRGRNGRGLSGPRSAAWPAHRHQGSQWRVGHRGPTLFVEARGTGRAPDSAPQRLPRLRPGPYGSHARPQRRIPDDGVARRRDAQPKAPPRGRTDRAPGATAHPATGGGAFRRTPGRRGRSLPARQALPLIRQLVAALSAAHQAGVVHGDFKSANVMIVPREGGSPRAVVTDFGLARRLAQGRGQTLLSASQSILAGYGTPAYMSPEQIQGGKATQAADIYALGVVLYEMLTGELPYGEESPLAMAVKKSREPPVAPESLSPALRRTWSAAILQCMAAEPGRRFSDVRRVLTHLETRTRSRLWWKLIRRRHRRLLRISMVAAGVAVALVLARWLWPAEPGAQAVADWQQGVYDLQAGEPVAADRRLERALSQHRLPPVAHAYLAWAWHELGFAAKAEAELCASHRKPLQSETDRLFEQAAAADLHGQPQQARAILARRGNDVAVLADLAFIDDQLGRPGAAEEWKQVAVRSPNHPAAHLRLAQWSAQQGQWKQAEREFILAETYFSALGDTDMVRAVSARRGFARVESGDLDQARNDLPALFNLQPRLPETGYAPCERTVTLMSGQDDHFALSVDPIPYVSPGFDGDKKRASEKHHKQFNEELDDVFLYASIILPRLTFCQGRIEIHVRKGKSGYQNDSVGYGVAPWVSSLPNSGPQLIWADTPDLHETLFTRMLTGDFLLDVQRAQFSKKVTSLDFAIGDDTTVDYIKLTLIY